MTISLTNYAGDFGNVTVGETVTLFLNFVGQLADNESITAVTGSQWIVSVAADSLVPDPSAAAVANGPANVNGTIAGQRLLGFVGGCKYLVQCFVTTNQGNNLDLWAHFFCEVPF